MGYCIERSWSPAMIGMFGADAQGKRKGGKVPREGGGGKHGGMAPRKGPKRRQTLGEGSAACISSR